MASHFYPPEKQASISIRRERLSSKHTSTDPVTDKEALRTNQHFQGPTQGPKPHLAPFSGGCRRACVCVNRRNHSSVCLTDWTFLTVGQVFSLLSPYMPVQISLTSYFQHFALCNTFVAACKHSLSFLSRCFPHCTRTSGDLAPFWPGSIWQSHRQKDEHVRGLHNKIIFALGC